MEKTEYLTINGKKIFTIFSNVGTKKLVIFCHGFRGDTTGPNRFFVEQARKLNDKNICTLRFDQYGCGNSEGKFENTTFNTWVKTTITITKKYLRKGYQVAFLGQSMGGACSIVSASQLEGKISSLVAWTPGIIKDKPKVKGKYMYEKSQRVKWKYWIDAYKANVINSFKKNDINSLIFFATKDEYVSLKDQEAFIRVAKLNQKIVTLDNELHSKWTQKTINRVFELTTNFLVSNFK